MTTGPDGGIQLVLSMDGVGVAQASVTACAVATEVTGKPVVSLQVLSGATYERQAEEEGERVRQALDEADVIPALVTPAGAAAVAGVSRQRIHELVEDDVLVSQRVGERTTVILRSSVDRFAASERKPGRKPAGK